MSKVINIVSAFLLVSSAYVIAETRQIEVSGIIPGVSTEEDMRRLSIEEDEYTKDAYLIGGYVFGVCGKEFYDGKLDYFYCLTGKLITRDTTKGDIFAATQNDNNAIHQTLVSGFANKFGPPDANINEVKRNKVGSEFPANTVMWKDQTGNMLILHSMYDQIDQGRLQIISARKVKIALERESKRNF